MNDAGDDADDDGEGIDNDGGDAREDVADGSAGPREAVGADAGECVGSSIPNEAERLAELPQGAGEGLEDRPRPLDGGAEALGQPLKEALDAEHRLEDADGELLHAGILRPVELLHHRAREAALLKQLRESLEEELDARGALLEEGADAPDVALEDHREAGHGNGQHREEGDGRQQRGHDAAEGDSDEFEPHGEEADAGLGCDDGAHEADGDADSEEGLREEGLHWLGHGREEAVDGHEGPTHHREDGLEGLGEWLADELEERLRRGDEALLLALEGVEEALLHLGGRPRGAGHLPAELLDGGCPRHHLPFRVADAIAEGLHDGDEAAAGTGREDGCQGVLSLCLRHARGMEIQLREDFDEGPHLPGAVSDLDADAGELLPGVLSRELVEGKVDGARRLLDGRQHRLGEPQGNEGVVEAGAGEGRAGGHAPERGLELRCAHAEGAHRQRQLVNEGPG